MEAASTLSNQTLFEQQLCAHCGTAVPESRKSAYCCLGCETVARILGDRGLGDTYYKLRNKGGFLREPLPASQVDERFDYLDDPEFLKNYSRPSQQDPTGRVMKLYLEGVHCAACVWLVEQLQEFVPGMSGARLDLGQSVVTIEMSAEGSFARAANEFAKIGYRPHPVLQGESEALQRKENRWFLARLGVAGAATGNIMLLAVSVYAGADEGFRRYFEWISFVLFLPVLLFSAVPFFRSSWSALKAGQVSIDQPIILGTVIAFTISTYNLVFDRGGVYFDSLSAFFFLILATRYFLRRTQQTAFNASHLLHFLAPGSARRIGAQGTEEVRVDALRPGDRVEVLAGDCIPVDGVALKGEGSISAALLSGESRPEAVAPGKNVFAGTINLDSALVIEVRAFGGATRLGGILASMEESLQRRAPILTFTDQVGKIFVFGVIVLSGLAFAIGGAQGWQEGLNRAMAVAVIICPCAFALATPLAMSLAIARSARRGILVKGADVVERLSQIKEVVLDKTGTLTYGNYRVLQWTQDVAEPELKGIVVALESRSRHPVARALVEEFSPGIGELPEVLVFHEEIGKGVSGIVGNHRYEVRRDGTVIGVFKDGKRVGAATVGDRIRADAAKTVEGFRRLGLKVSILSGDSKQAVDAVADQLGISREDAMAEASPEAKAKIIAAREKALMIGDGANDAVALAAGYVSVAVHSGMEVSLRAADAYLCRPGVGEVLDLIQISRDTMSVVYRNLAFSILYNAVGVTAAFMGKVSPLVAAIIMPVSAMTVFLSSTIGTRAIRRMGRLGRQGPQGLVTREAVT